MARRSVGQVLGEFGGELVCLVRSGAAGVLMDRFLWTGLVRLLLLRPFFFVGFNLMKSVFLASAWCLGFSGVPKSGFSGVWGSGALFYTGGSGGFLGFGGSGALFYTGGFRWFARRPLAQRRKSPKGDTSGGGHPRRETRPEAKLPGGRHARRRTSSKGDTP